MYVMYRPWNYINICNMYSYHTTIYTHYESVLISLHIYNIIYTYVYILFLLVAIAAQSDVLKPGHPLLRLASVHALQLLTTSLEFLLGPRRMSINDSKGSKGAGAPRANRPHTDTLIKHDQDTLMDIVSRDELQRMLDDYTADVKAAVKEELDEKFLAIETNISSKTATLLQKYDAAQCRKHGALETDISDFRKDQAQLEAAWPWGLLTAAGMLKHKTSKTPKTSTATEHAASSSELDSAASTDDVALGPLLSMPTPRWSSEDGFCFFPGDPDLEKIVALLLWLARDFQPMTHMDVIHHTALDTIIKCADDPTGRALGLLHTASIAKLSRVIDIMMVHKDGSPKDANETLRFMRRCARTRHDVFVMASDNATERVQLTEDEVSSCYQRFGRYLITHDLLEHQKQDDRYRLRNKSADDTHLSGFQRSFVDNMLRKFLGDKRVALFIWQHGLPSIATKRHAHTHGLSSKFDKGMLQSSLDECLRWYVALANDIVSHQTQEGFDGQRSASSLDREERQRQQTRRQALQKAQEAVRLGATLAEQRDGGKRSYDDMDEAEQKTLEDHDTGRTKKAKQGFAIPKMKPFRANQ